MKKSKNMGSFTSTIYIDDNNIDRFTSGRTSLRIGQWVKFAWTNRRSRWIGVSSGGVIHAYHDRAGNGENFARRVQAYKMVSGLVTNPRKR